MDLDNEELKATRNIGKNADELSEEGLKEEKSEEFDWCDWVSLDIRNETDIIKACVHLKRNLEKGENIDFLQQYFFEGVQGLLDLYRSKTKQLETAINSLREEKEKNKELEMQLLEKDLHIDGLKEDRRIAIEEIQEEYYISKDKIREKIKTLDETKQYWTKEVISILKEFLEEN